MWGFAPYPTYFFVLKQKSMQKNSRLRPLRSKNLRSVGSNRPNSFRRNTSELKQGRFLTAYLTCFSAHWTRSVRFRKVAVKLYVLNSICYV